MEKAHLLASPWAIEALQREHPAVYAEAVESVLPFVAGVRPDPAALARVTVAFLSREITGSSTKQVVLPPLEEFMRCALSAPALQWIHTHSAGIDRPFYGELKERGVVITTSSGSNSTIIAQSVLGAILALSRRFPLLRDAQQRREWLPLRGPLTPPDLAGQKAVIVGWGAIGRQVGAYLRMLELEVTAVRRSGTGDSADGVRMISFEEFKSADPEYDWIVLACPLTETTFHLLDRAFLGRLGRQACVLNIARGDVVDEEALIEALREQRLAGAYLDVFAHEPLPADSELWSLPNTLVSPHSSAHATGNPGRVLAMFAENLGNWVRGNDLMNRAA